ncbi:MAG: aminotransferase class IV, partial [Candidatus Neomarinimicrobiota bacterium]
PWKYTGPSNLYIDFRFIDSPPHLPVKVKFVTEADYPIARMVPALKSMTYLGNMLAIRDAVAEGAFEPVFVNRDGVITECSVRNIFFIKGNTLHTPDTSLGILPGVTRDLIMELATDFDLTVDTAPILATDVGAMDEAFISSTGIGVYPVTWDGFHSTEYPVAYRVQAAVERQVQAETGDPIVNTG